MKSLKRFIKEFMQRTIPEEPNSTLIQNIPEKGLGLDAGAGDGRYADFLNNKDRMILSLDLNQPKKRKPDIQYIVGSIEYLPFKSDVFDFVYSLSVLQFLENDNQAVYELHRVLKAKQKFIFTVPTKYSTFHFLRELELYYNVYPYPEWNSHFYHYFSKTRINQLLNKNFSGKKIKSYGLLYSFFGSFYQFNKNLAKKSQNTQLTSYKYEENSIEPNKIEYYQVMLQKNPYWIFNLFNPFFSCFAYHYVVVSEKK